ncbi:MAG: hypothetical protein ACOCY0_02290 [Roseicyclus sp.]
MPDPAKSIADIDDVLSSIRRLVAEQPGRDLSGGIGPLTLSVDSADPAGTGGATGGDRLVLTPDFRVPDPDLDPGPVGEADATGAPAQDTGNGATPAQDADDVSLSAPDADNGATPAQDADINASPAQDGNGDATPAQDMVEPSGEDATDFAADVIPSDGAVPDAGPEAGASGQAPQDGPDAGPGVVAGAGGPEASLAAAPGGGVLPDDAEPAPGPDLDRAVGSTGWQAEIPLYAWQEGGGSETPDTAAHAPVPDYEPEADDADWPDEGTSRALLDLAAARGMPVSEAPAEAGDDPARATGADPDAAVVEDPDRAPVPPDATAATDDRPMSSRLGAAVSAHRKGADSARGQRPEDVTLNPFSAAAGSEIGGDDMEDWDYDDAFAGLAGDGEAAARMETEATGHTAQTAPATDPQPADADPAPPGPSDTAPEQKRTVAQAGAASDDGTATVEAAMPSPPQAVTDAPGRATEEHADEAVDKGRIATRDGIPAGPVLAVDTPPETDAPVAPPETAQGEDPDLEATLLDEETLRRIVAEVVREELQGALGERITRNVRKLVRREIRLVLAADELD